ncbi:ATP-binding protein, partial [Undibacterium sp.]|uniref:ATP-binding protein n=1 Tax=Undibacterium sp. TaxID=1914977 RepID=UPI002D13748D
VVLQAWDQAGKLVYSSDPQSALPLYPQVGFKTAAIDGEHWRIYTRNKQNLTVQVSQPASVRQKLAAKIALRCLFPFLVLLPFLAGFIWVAVGRSLVPLNLFAHAVSSRSPTALQPLSTAGLSPEVKPVCDALNDLLRQLDLALSTQRAFIADAAHELRTPLAALKLQLQLVERAASEQQRQAAFEKLHDRLDRASHLVQQLLTLARHEPGRGERPFEAVDLQKLAKQVVVDYYALAAGKNIDLGLEADASTPHVSGNLDDLRILLNNLVDNALRYTPQGGNVDISVLSIGGRPAVRVVDNGPGIPESDHVRVFDRFYRCEETEPWGSGLGLSIAKNIADMHSAAIQLGTGSAGRGLAVTLIF